MKNITIPTLLLDKEKCLRNIRFMVDKANISGVKLRPHFKTHQSAEVGEWFREAGVEAITVSSLRMARYFADHGWKDIMVAFPVNVLEINLINNLAADVSLNLVAVNPESIQALGKGLTRPVNIWLKIDTGYKRTGIHGNDHDEVELVLNEIEQHQLLNFKGFLAHDGHTYKQRDPEVIRNIHQTTVYLLNLLSNRFKARYPDLQLSIGDTPSCSIMEQFKGIDEIRPGNFVFYDLMQQHIGSCNFEQIAVCMACPVVAMHPDRNEIIIYGGSVHFSKDAIVRDNGEVLFGLIVELNENGWSEPLSDMALISLSQEHGIIRASASQFRKYKVGDVVGILPIHSCLTADLMKSYLTLGGERLEHLSGKPSYMLPF